MYVCWSAISCWLLQKVIRAIIIIVTWSTLLQVSMSLNSIQKRYLKMVTQSVYNLSSLWPSRHVNKYNKFAYIYTKQHRFIGQIQAKTTDTFIQKHTHKHPYLTYTLYIQTCTFTKLSLIYKKEQYIINNKHVEQERS